MTTTTTTGSRLQGIDVSHFQGTVRWDQVAGAGIGFAFVKATGGITYTDPQFHINWNGARQAGILRGAYHFFYALDDAGAQAANFLAAVGSLNPGDLPPVLDVEITDGAEPQAISAGALAWLSEVHQKLGRLPIVYSNPSFAARYLTDGAFAAYPLWIADYGPPTPTVPPAWKTAGWTFWQHSQSGTVPGIDGAVDLDLFSGTAETLARLLQQGSQASETAT